MNSNPCLIWNSENNGLKLVANKITIGEIPPFSYPFIETNDQVSPIGDGVFLWERRFSAPESFAGGPVRLTMDFVANYRSTFSMIPPINFDGNPWGSGKEPKDFTRNGKPWAFAAHRTSIPGGTYSEGDAWSVALYAKSPVSHVGCACSLVPTEQSTLHQIIWPEEETPEVYANRDEYEPGYKNELILEPGQTFSTTAILVVKPISQPRAAWRHLLNTAWRDNYRRIKPRYSPEEVWKLGIEFAKESLWSEDGLFRGFSIGLSRRNGQWVQREYGKYEIGWAGQNLSLANALLADAVKTDDASSLNMGLDSLDAWAAHAPLPNGCIRSHFDPILGCERPYVNDACNIGTAAEHFFEAFELATECGFERPVYRKIALDICDFVLKQIDDNGRIGKSWDNDGQCLDKNGTVGAFLIRPLITAYTYTDDSRYIEAAKRAFEFYVAELRHDGFTTAGALDTHCIDKESAYPLLDSALLLYDVTSDRQYVADAELAAYYLAIWQWHHSARIPKGSVLDQIRYDTFGGTSVSTQHHHQDPWGHRFINAWLRVAELTDNELFRTRAEAAWTQGMYGLSDGSLTVDDMHIPAGAQFEGYFNTRWQNYGGVSTWLVAWPTAFRLETLRRRKDWSLFWG